MTVCVARGEVGAVTGVVAGVWVLALVTAGEALAQPVGGPLLTGEERKRLAAGEVLLRERRPTDDRGYAAEAVAMVAFPPARVWPVVRDCQHFSEFLPATRASWVKEENGERICFDEVELPLGLSPLWAEVKTAWREEPKGHYLRTWSLVRGTYARNRGSWTVVPFGPEGQQSLVVYAFDNEPAMQVPAFVIRLATGSALPRLFAAIRERVVKHAPPDAAP